MPGDLHGQGVLVEAIADITAAVAGVGSAVDNALGIVNISITRCAARRGGLGWVAQVDEEQTSAASAVTGNSADSNGVVLLLVDDDVVGGSLGKTVEVTSQVLGVGECDGLGRVDSQELAPVEDLDTVAGCLASDDDVVLVASDLSPDGVAGVLGQTSKVDKLTSRGDLSKGSTVGLSNDDEFTASVTGPTPRGSTLSSCASKIGVVLEVVEVNLSSLSVFFQ